MSLNSRLDTLQAAILIEKLAIYADELETRERVAQTYARELAPYLDVPAVPEGCNSVWAQYTVKARPGQSRDDIMAELKNQGVPTAVYYPRTLHKQTAYSAFPTRSDERRVGKECDRKCRSRWVQNH